MADKKEIESKRAAVASRIKELAPNAEMLVAMLDEVKLDLLLIALAGARVKLDDAPHD